METSADPAPTTTTTAPRHNSNKDLKSQIANFEELVGNILSTGERAGDANSAAMLDQMIALHAAIEENNVDAISQLASEGVDLNERFVENVNPQHVGITPLALACATNKVPIVQALIEHGADVNAPFAALNTTALMTSAYHGHTEVVRVLIQCGADVQMVDLQQSTALGYSFGGSRNLDVIQLLLDANIDVNKKNMLGMNSLLLVAGYGNEALVEKILRAGAEPNTVNDFGHTALHLTVVGKRDLLKKLRRLGSAEAVAADRSLNRRNLDVAIQEWARLHRDEVGGTLEDEHALAKAGSIMMSVGHQLEDHPGEDDDEQAVLQKRVQAVWKHRQEKIQKNREKSKSGLWSLLSCGGGKSSKVDNTSAPGAKPYSPTAQLQAEPPKAPQDEFGRLSQSFARILRLLIDARCEIDRAEKTFGMTALDLAILNGDVESSAVLTSAGADPNHFLKMLALKDLYQAIVTGQRKEVKDLLTYDEDLDVNQIFSRFNVDTQSTDEGMTPLTLATRLDDIEMVKMLLKKGANANLMGPSGCFPLAETSVKGNIKMASLLLANGASLEKTCPAMQDATPLSIACNNQKHKLVEFYLKRGAKVDCPMSDGRIPLLKASEAQDMEMVDILLRQSTQDNFGDIQGLTAHLAAEYQSKDRDTEAILSKVADAVRVFQEEEEALKAANTSINTTQENNEVHMQQPRYNTPPEAMPAHGHPQQQGYHQPPPQQAQEQMERVQVPQQHHAPPQPEPVQMQQYIPQHEEPVPEPEPQPQEPPPPMQPSRPAPTARPRALQQSQQRPTQPAPPVPQPEPEFDVSEIVTTTVVTKRVVVDGHETVITEKTVSNEPPPVPTSAPPTEEFAVEPAQPAASTPEPRESSSPKAERKEEEMDENSSTESEYTTDDDEDDDDDDDDDEEEEEEQTSPEASPAQAEERPGIIITKVVRNAPVAMAEMVELEGETDIDAPSPHETSDVNENVVKEEMSETTVTTVTTTVTHVPESPNANPPPLPVTSPPHESTETTV